MHLQTSIQLQINNHTKYHKHSVLSGRVTLSLFFGFFTGKFAFFKAIVTGDPQPSVTWSRNNGDVSDMSRYQTKYDPLSNEHTFEASDSSYQITATRNSNMLM